MKRAIELPVKVMFRALPVCANCWNAKHPDRPATIIKVSRLEECIDCQNPTNAGIYVRVRIEW